VQLDGAFVSLFDPSLAVQRHVTLHPGDVALLYDLNWAREHAPLPAVAAASTRIRGEVREDGALSFLTRGPVGTVANVQLLVANAPDTIELTPPVPFEQRYHAGDGALFLTFENAAADIAVRMEFP